MWPGHSPQMEPPSTGASPSHDPVLPAAARILAFAGGLHLAASVSGGRLSWIPQ